MTARKAKAAPKPAVPAVSDQEKRGHFTRGLVAPFHRHGMTVTEVLNTTTSKLADAERPRPIDYADELHARAKRAKDGDLAQASELLMAQAMTLDAIFAEYARISVGNIGTRLDGAERLMRLALKAQSNSRATIETLARLHQPREQTVRHVHVNEGGQAVIAGQFHHHAGGPQNVETAEQPHEPRYSTDSGTALPSPDPLGNGVPVPGHPRTEAVPIARGS